MAARVVKGRGLRIQSRLGTVKRLGGHARLIAQGHVPKEKKHCLGVSCKGRGTKTGRGYDD